MYIVYTCTVRDYVAGYNRTIIMLTVVCLEVHDRQNCNLDTLGPETDLGGGACPDYRRVS